ncbi:MAG: aspartate/glutamate racemase family protein, partial [Proteobacteria bacterium]|nr:aspartate/glutamate racemase family protein [Pseudomonadota bacterium]
MACVGIVGGLGVGATVHYYEKIAAACKARGVAPDLVFNHADANTGQVFVREGRLDRLGDYLAPYVEQLGKAGAEAVAIPAVTPHIAIAEITARTKVPLINI